MIVSVACFSIGSFILINSGFHNSLKREVASAYTENDMIRYSLNDELANISGARLYLNHERMGKAELTQEDRIRWVASSVTVYASEGEILFKISNKNHETIYDVLNKQFQNQIFKLSEKEKGHEIVKVNDKYYIHTIVPFFADKDLFYIENFKDVSKIFENRNSQYTMYLYIIIGMIIIIAIVIFITSWLLTKPINNLTKATKQIAKGDFGERIYEKSYEEIEHLSENFNLMASNLEKMIDTLKETNLRQETFIGSFAHEIKTPLTSMIGYADMLRSKKMSQEQIIMSAHYIFEEGKRLEVLSMKLLEMIVLKKQDIQTKLISAKEFFKDIQGTMYPVFEKAEIEFIVSAEDVLIQVETDLMKTVCINLLDNAKKAIVNNNGKVIFMGKKMDDEYIIQIKDNGKGMVESEFSRITEPFYMVDKSRARVQGGAGLGLTICSEIIKLHGATMSFESNMNEGTCVTIRLKGVGGLS